MYPYMLALVLYTIFSGCISDTSATVKEINYATYFVQASDQNSSCPVDVEHCHTLDFYAQNNSFKSNRTFIFMSGTHKLTYEIIVNGVDRLSLNSNGNESVQIICTNYSAGFAFFDATNLQIRNLKIHKCGIHRDDYSPIAGAVIIKNSLNASLKSLVITNTSGFGLTTINTRGVLSVTNSTFAYNKNDSHYEGGNTRIVFSACDDFSDPRYVFIKNSQFLFGNEYYRDLETVGCGGLTLVMACFNVKVHIDDSVFDYNVGYFGANIYIVFKVVTNNSVAMSNVTSCHGTGNRGPGLYIELVDTIGLMDPYSCDRRKWTAKENVLIDITGFCAHMNYGGGTFNIEDRTYRITDCVTQYAVVRNSNISDNSYTNWPGTAVHFGYVPIYYTYNMFKLIATTFDNCGFHRNSGYNTPSEKQVTRVSSALYFEMVTNVTIINCSIGNNSVTGIQAFSSNIYFKGNTTIFGNTGYFGAGLLLMQNSFMFLSPDTHITFFNNSAKTVGGALLSDFDLQMPTVCPCFFQLDIFGSSSVNNSILNSIKVTFHNNTAGLAGSAIFGGRVTGCLSFRSGRTNSHSIFKKIFLVNNIVEDPSAVTSDPFYACFCPTGSKLPNCSVTTHYVKVYPGDNFQVSIATVGGNRGGTIPGVVHSKFLKGFPNASFAPLQAAQDSGKRFCSNINYTIYALQTNVQFSIATDKVSYFPVDNSTRVVNVTLLSCPPGFELDPSTGKCDCEKHIQRSDILCFITSQTILPPLGSWVGFHNSSTQNKSLSGAIFHRYCPYYYCTSQHTHVCLNDTDSQCSSNRSGILCGQCQSGLSLTLGRNQCALCSNTYLVLTFVFALAGVILVVFLFCLRLTVSEGSINGLIFYANVVKMNQALLLPNNKTNFLSVFIAWMNLDVGIDVCFFDGMDGFAKTFLQFVFPAYIWLLVGVVICLANQFQFISDLVGQRAVQVLATLLLLSYTKLQRVIVTIFTYTSLEYPDGSVHYVWLYDGNVGYFKGIHIVLLAAALVCFLLILPYTTLLTFFKFLQAHSDKKLMSWINRLKPFIDAYAGPYKDKFRFWTGFLLLSRTLFILALSLNKSGSPDYNLTASALMSVILLLISSSTGGIYKKWPYNILESTSYFNIAAVSIVLLYSKSNQYAVLNCSIGLSFALFLLVVFVHSIKYTCFSVVITRFRDKFCGIKQAQEDLQEELLFNRENSEEFETYPEVDSIHVENSNRYT